MACVFYNEVRVATSYGDEVTVRVWSMVLTGACRRLPSQCSVTSRQCIDVPGSVYCRCYEGYAGSDCSQSTLTTRLLQSLLAIFIPLVQT